MLAILEKLVCSAPNCGEARPASNNARRQAMGWLLGQPAGHAGRRHGGNGAVDDAMGAESSLRSLDGQRARCGPGAWAGGSAGSAQGSGIGAN